VALIIWLAEVALVLNATLLPVVLVATAAVDKDKDRAQPLQQVQLTLEVVEAVEDMLVPQIMVLLVGLVL
jgi:hypothetical protein